MGWNIYAEADSSDDSVFQITAHEDIFGLQRSYDLCKLVKQFIEPFHIAHVIARLFIGNWPYNFQRIANCCDLITSPIAPTLLDHGCDTTGSGSDHMCEQVSVVPGPLVKVGNLGEQTIVCHLGLESLLHGTACEIFNGLAFNWPSNSRFGLWLH